MLEGLFIMVWYSNQFQFYNKKSIQMLIRLVILGIENQPMGILYNLRIIWCNEILKYRRSCLCLQLRVNIGLLSQMITELAWFRILFQELSI